MTSERFENLYGLVEAKQYCQRELMAESFKPCFIWAFISENF